MEYPKKLMTVSELAEMGFPRQMIYDMAHTPGQKYCFRKGDSPKGHLLIDTALFEKARLKRLVR